MTYFLENSSVSIEIYFFGTNFGQIFLIEQWIFFGKLAMFERMSQLSDKHKMLGNGASD